MKKIPLYLLLSAMLQWPLHLHAQDSPLGCWKVYNGTVHFSEKTGINFDLNQRSYNALDDLEQILLRGGLYFNLPGGNVQLMGGFAWAYTAPYISGTDEKTDFEERRFHQQVVFRQQTGRLFMSHRYRVEERFFSNRNNFRFRYQLLLQIPLNKTVMEPRSVYMILMDEIFINDRSPAFDRNRSAAGIGYVLHKNLRAECSYMWQMLEKSTRPQIVISIVQQLRLHD
jgi:hypothetical protein